MWFICSENFLFGLEIFVVGDAVFQN